MSTIDSTKTSLKPLEKLDIVISIFNQEEIIERVLYGVFRNTTTPFNLILIFDGCTDKTKPRALKYIKKVKPALLKELIIKDTPNLFELRANNTGFKLAQTDYLITIQDDMVIQEYGWERRLTYPLRKFDDVFIVTARVAEDIKKIGNGVHELINKKGREFHNLPRDIFAIRDVVCRGPLAFRMDYLKELDYLNDKYAPCALDDYEICLRAWRDKKWKAGSYWIKYLSQNEWSKTHSPDSTMKAFDMAKRNRDLIYQDFKEYIDLGIKHDEDLAISDKEVDYIINNSIFLKKVSWLLKYPLRFDKRVIFNRIKILRRSIIEILKFPILILMELILGKIFMEMVKKDGIKKAFTDFFSNKKSSKLLTICIPTLEMGMDGIGFLRHNLNILKDQTFKDFDIVVSDNSNTDSIKNLCDEYAGILDIHYFKYRKNSQDLSSNLNYAIKESTGKIIKFLLQKDFLFNTSSLDEIVKNFNLEKDNWLITACEHTKDDGKTFYWPAYQRYNDEIHLGTLTITSLSVITIKNDKPILFDTKLQSFREGDYYKQYYIKFGKPKILNTVNVVSRTLKRNDANTALQEKKIRGREYRYILKKYNEKKLLEKYDNRIVTNTELKKVALIVVGNNKSRSTQRALEMSTDGISYQEIVFCEKIPKPEEIDVLIKADFALIISANGFVLRPYKWNNKFLEYDHIGLPNGSFSLQSKRFLKKEIPEHEIRYATPEIIKEFCNSTESFGFDQDKYFLPRFFILRKILKKIPILKRIKSLLTR